MGLPHTQPAIALILYAWILKYWETLSRGPEKMYSATNVLLIRDFIG